MDDFSDILRRLESMIRIGTIAEVRLGKPPRVRVSSGGLTSDWRPWCAVRAGTTSDWSPPVKGEQVLMLSPSGNPESALIIGGIFSDAFPAPSDSADLWLRKFPDGAVIEYNHVTGALSATGMKTATVQASEHCTVDCPESDFTGNVTIKGNLTVMGTGTVTGLFSYLGGMAGRGGQGARTVIETAIEHRGDFTNSGTLSSNGVTLHTHTHPDSHGGNTGGPK
ncbi:phage baseplate assembly protein V [Paludibacterium paludis]|nr:phage baseplate assembly protein V [Paludibacterium paludis]